MKSSSGCFNPSVGILGVQAPVKITSRMATVFVSIPQSGFWVFKRRMPLGLRRSRIRFNPSVGILGVQAELDKPMPGLTIKFQSLSRDSGCSS